MGLFCVARHLFYLSMPESQACAEAPFLGV